MILDLELRVKLVRPEATVPAYKTAGAAALDLCAAEEWSLWPGHRHTIDTGVAIELPPGWCGQVKSRSGLARDGHTVDWGLIDSDYRGAIGVHCVNASDKLWHIRPGDRIAQLVLVPVGRATIVEAATLGETDRGERGFGSTGVR